MTGRRLALAAGLGLAVAGCSSVHPLSVPTPPASVAVVTTTTTVAPDLTGVAEAAVGGSTTTTAPAVGPGAATLAGTILGPGGPVAGATVQAQRIVGGATATTEATTGADGSWSIPDVLGGVWRVRAWQAPTLDLTTPQIMYLPGTGTQQLTLTLTQFSGETLAASAAPSVVAVGGVADVLASLTQEAVGTDGVVRAEPVVGAGLGLSVGPGWSIAGSAMTGSDGTANFLLTCTEPGPADVTVNATGADDASVDTTSCQAATAPTSTTIPVGSTTTSTTSVPGLP